MFENIKRDSARYADLDGWYANLGFWITATYRFGVWADLLPTPFPRLPIRALYRLARILWRILFNVDIWAGRKGARIGPGLCLIHPANILIGSGAKIGENCLIFHEVTIGSGPIPGEPKIGNNVDIYIGARVLGGIEIGDRCMIGANCVVKKSLPPESVVIQAANRVVHRSLSPVARAADARAGQNVKKSPALPPP